MLKPNAEGSSVGLALVSGRAELAAALGAPGPRRLARRAEDPRPRALGRDSGRPGAGDRRDPAAGRGLRLREQVHQGALGVPPARAARSRRRRGGARRRRGRVRRVRLPRLRAGGLHPFGGQPAFFSRNQHAAWHEGDESAADERARRGVGFHRLGPRDGDACDCAQSMRRRPPVREQDPRALAPFPQLERHSPAGEAARPFGRGAPALHGARAAAALRAGHDRRGGLGRLGGARGAPAGSPRRGGRRRPADRRPRGRGDQRGPGQGLAGAHPRPAAERHADGHRSGAAAGARPRQRPGGDGRDRAEFSPGAGGAHGRALSGRPRPGPEGGGCAADLPRRHRRGGVSRAPATIRTWSRPCPGWTG